MIRRIESNKLFVSIYNRQQYDLFRVVLEFY
jgi:hypothetical protein